MPKLVPIKPKLLGKILLYTGFSKREACGSHIFFGHADGRITVIPMHNRQISQCLLRKILHDIDLTLEEYDNLRRKV
ncbi:MAG: type II toxin-antitoxin system HicA family toxin [Parcubacteria group bacterium]|nr:type II toxin-antitoxin system HicA family toxin [Parcubacteria group bacterium]